MGKVMSGDFIGRRFDGIRHSSRAYERILIIGIHNVTRLKTISTRYTRRLKRKGATTGQTASISWLLFKHNCLSRYVGRWRSYGTE